MEIINSRVLEAQKEAKQKDQGDSPLDEELLKVTASQTIEKVEIKTLNIYNKGEEVPTMCVEFTVVGKRNGNKWRDFLTLDEFAKHNPELLKELLN